MSRKCGMGCDALAERGGFYCHGCLARWDREANRREQKKRDLIVDNEIQALRKEVAKLKRRIKEVIK